MIKHHPQQELLVSHANGDLPLSMAIAVAAHCALCETCREQLALLTEQAANLALNPDDAHAVKHTDKATIHTAHIDAENTQATNVPVMDIDAMLAQIMAQPAATDVPSNAPLDVQVKQQHYTVPSVFRQHLARPWQILGKVSRMRFDVDEMNTRASLLHIDAQGEIPQHTHKGYELTLLLAGEFSDLNGDYVPGDFIVLNSQHHHSPKTVDGCLCYTVLDAPLHFTKGLSKLLNPIGELIY
ncbi:anti-ECF sigma factor ChrR [Shewanella hafniensis]|uniref:ChrR family anti-sigma-E factor n=1 Tax=Shewanella hafniensis TaxID=365590 RepID=UPI001BC4F11C|nr:ChrR family anti-sigma-E factor [Shewanella hafniensis]MCL1136281.1 ChrR family anti-sigma-E factor [Shewanella hafniensis]GIU37431.1 anti-ECF sigma factor ChrR [Shewanella hafniensis]